MKKTLIAVTLVALAGWSSLADDLSVSSPSSTSFGSGNPLDHRFGVGVILGEPTGLSAKYFWDDQWAVDTAIGVGFRDETDFYWHASVLYHWFDLIPVSRGKLPLYFGVGPRVKNRDNDDPRFGLRFPVGVSYIFDNSPIDVFGEVAPILDFSPTTRGGVTASIGIRYWF